VKKGTSTTPSSATKLIKRRPHTQRLSDFGFPGPRANRGRNPRSLPSPKGEEATMEESISIRKNFHPILSYHHIAVPLSFCAPTHPSTLAVPRIRNAVKPAWLSRNPAKLFRRLFRQHTNEAAQIDITTMNVNPGLKPTSFQMM
jgi:hypothetical protein